MSDSTRQARGLKESATGLVQPWKRFRPRTIGGLVLLCFILVVIPPLLGIWIVDRQVASMSELGAETVARAISVTRSGHRLVEGVEVVERTARQYRVLSDQESRQRFEQALDSLSEEARLLSEEADSEQRERIAGLEQAMEPLGERVLEDAGDEAREAGLSRVFANLRQDARAILLEGELQVGRQTEQMRQQSIQARRAMLWQLGLTLAVAVILALIFTGVIARPVRRLERGIRGLADPSSAPPGRVDYPRDLAMLSLRLRGVHTRLRRAERDRERFLHHVSHELKTPLSALREGISLLRDGLVGRLGHEQAEVTDILDKSARQLQTRIEDLLRYNQLQSAPRDPLPDQVAIADSIHRVLETFSASVRARELDIRVDLPPDLSVCADPDRLETIMENLLSNAIKHASHGGEIRVAGWRSASRVRVEVSDDGPGIPDSERSRVFEPFFRGTAPAEGQMPGTGLGLAISRELARGHGGDLWLKPASGRGATFCLELPDRAPITEESA